MSRIGSLPINIPEGVSVDLSEKNWVTVKGPLGALSQKLNPQLKYKLEDNQLIIERPGDEKKHKAMHGLYRSLMYNMVYGVSKGFEIKQELVGIGFRAESRGQRLSMSLGYSHDIIMELPPEIKVEAHTQKRSNPIITLKSYDKHLLGMVANKIRSLRPPEPYKGKGIRYVGEHIRRKAGKAASV